MTKRGGGGDVDTLYHSALKGEFCQPAGDLLLIIGMVLVSVTWILN